VVKSGIWYKVVTCYTGLTRWAEIIRTLQGLSREKTLPG